MARYTTPAQQARLDALAADWNSYEDWADLDAIRVDGRYSLEQLRTVVEALTQCDAELGAAAARVLRRNAGVDLEEHDAPDL